MNKEVVECLYERNQQKERWRIYVDAPLNCRLLNLSCLPYRVRCLCHDVTCMQCDGLQAGGLQREEVEPVLLEMGDHRSSANGIARTAVRRNEVLPLNKI
jgi:hypothetical protein